MREKWLLAGVLLAATSSADAAQSNENDTLRDKTANRYRLAYLPVDGGACFRVMTKILRCPEFQFGAERAVDEHSKQLRQRHTKAKN